MSYNENCLLCLQKRVSYLPPREWIEKGNLPNFRTLCQYLKITFTGEVYEHLAEVPSFVNDYENDDERTRNGTCDKFLCLDCFDLVYKISKLYQEAEDIQKKITEVTSDIRNVIIKNSPCRRGRTGRRNSEFVELFQTVVKSTEGNADFKKEPGCGSSADSRLKAEEKEEPSSKRIKAAGKEKPSSKRIKAADKGEPSPKRIKAAGKEKSSSKRIKAAEKGEPSPKRIKAAEKEEPSPKRIKAAEKEKLSSKNSNQTVSKQTPDEKSISPQVTQADIKLKTEIRKRKRKSVKNLTSSKTTRTTKFKVRILKPSQHFTCRDCNATFESSFKYYIHRKTHRLLTAKTIGIPTYYEMKNKKRIIVRVCSICGYKSQGKSASLAVFMEHCLSHENEAGSNCESHTCNLCSRQFSHKLNLDLHQICHHDTRHVILKCEHCGDVNSKTREEFINHLKTHNDSVHSCKSCPMSCTTLDKVLTHMLKHSRSHRLWCPVCPFVSTSLSDVYKHCQSNHSDLKERYACELCNKPFLNPTSLKIHMNRAHEENSTGEYRCPKCTNSRVYTTKKILNIHLLHMHGDDKPKPHKCDQCDKSFLYKSLLQNHIEQKHERIRYPCPHCTKSYTERQHLGHHLKTHTGEGLYTCQSCGKKFPTKGQLKIHSVVHLVKSAENTCVCEVCGKEFGSVHRLRQHKNIHKDKKLECEYCGLKFGRRDNFRSHLRTHTGERPFICAICSKGFNRKDIMTVHMKVHGLSPAKAAELYKRHTEENANFVI